MIHAATEASDNLNQHQPQVMFDSVVEGSARVLEFARLAKVKACLFVSSGAVYGKQPFDLLKMPEEYLEKAVPLEDKPSAYAAGKRAAEKLCQQYAEEHHLNIKIARCFAFVGPHLPLDAHFAIGNFIRDGLQGGPIRVLGDGTSYRSYLYAADLVIWLWTILFRGQTMRPYNVGSEESLTIKELAHLVGEIVAPAVEVQVGKILSREPAERYVPDISRAKQELGLRVHMNLKQAIHLTKAWNLKHGKATTS